MQEKTKKTSFLKKVLISIKDFDKYELFIKEDLGQAVKYLFKLIAIFTLVITAISVYQFSKAVTNLANVIENNLNEITYENDVLSINHAEKVTLTELNPILGEIVIDTSDLTEEQIEEYRATLTTKGSGIYLLKDRIILKSNNLLAIAESKYSEIEANHKIESFNKEQLINYYNKHKTIFLLITAFTMYIYMFIIYTFNILIDCFAFTLLAYVTAKITRVNLMVSQSFKIAIHSLTLPIILNILYLIVNAFTGFSIKYFSIMYTAITYIYILTIILMIKSDYIRIIGEVKKIEKQQEIIREKLEEEKKQKEKEDVKKRDREKENEEPKIGNNPEGDNA